MKKLTEITALLLAATLLLTACGGSSGAVASAGNTANASPSESSGSKSGRDTINLSLNQVIETLNPYDSSAIIDSQLYCQIYERLFFFNDTGELEPRLAESYEVGSDNMTYTVHLRKGVKFHNGKEMKARTSLVAGL
jgi:peptide/nickel transport system substrate-binding protein